MTDDTISRQAAIDNICKSWCKTPHNQCQYKVLFDDEEMYCDGCEDVEILQNMPSAQPTLYGYDIKHLAFVASIMAKKGVSPEEAVTAFRDVNSVIEIMLEEMKEMQENTLKKLYAVRPAEGGTV